MDARARNVSAGIFVVVGAVLILVASTRPWVSVSGPGFLPLSVDLGFDNHLVKPPFGFWNARPYLVAEACVLVAAAVALTVTRLERGRRAWRWPLVAVAVLPAALAGLTWAYVVGAGAAVQSIVGKATQFLPDFIGLDSIGVRAGSGLWLLTVGAVVVLVGVLLAPQLDPQPVGTGQVLRAPVGDAARPALGAAARPAVGEAARPAVGEAARPAVGEAARPAVEHASQAPAGPPVNPPTQVIRRPGTGPRTGAGPGPAPGSLTVPLPRTALQAGWYPDHQDPRRLRWFDGRVWTEATRSSS